MSARSLHEESHIYIYIYMPISVHAGKSIAMKNPVCACIYIDYDTCIIIGYSFGFITSLFKQYLAS